MKGRLKTCIEFFRRPLCVNHFRGQSPRYGTCVTKKICSVGFAHEPLKISDDLYVYRFRGRNPRYGTCVAKKLCSVDYAHEPLKIPTNNPPKIPDAKKSRPIRSAFDLSY